MSAKQKLKQAEIDLDLAEVAIHKEIADIDEELAGLDKPKLRHGDYGYCDNAKPVLVCREGASGIMRAAHAGGILENLRLERLEGYAPRTILGNIFDDLARNAKDLSEFGVDSCELNTLKGRFVLRHGGNGMKWITCDNHCFSTSGLIEIHQKLGQVIATAKRNQ